MKLASASFLLLGAAASLTACSPSSEPAQPGPPVTSAGTNAGGQPSASAGNAGTATGGQSSAVGGGGASTGGASPATGGGGQSGGSGGASGGSATGELAMPSEGCTKAPAIATGEFVSLTVMNRPAWIRLPLAYDPMRAYPLIFLWKGCSAAGVSSFGLQNVAGEDAILAEIDFPPGQDCYDTADGAMFVDIPVFDALLAQAKATYCVDQAHVFSVGFSSGAWMTQLLACQRGDVLRGIGTIAGAFKPAFLNGAPSCAGDGLSAFMVSDLTDHNNPFYDEDSDGDSVEVAVNHWLEANGCTEKPWTLTAGTPATPDMAVCREYAGCGENPVKLCLTDGKGHTSQDALSMPGFWEMFQRSLPH